MMSERRLSVEKHIVKWSFWLGLACAVIAFVLRALNAVGLFVPDLLPGANISYMGFYKAALLLLAVAIGAASTMCSRGQKDQKE
jgi:hypothetical protein